MTTKYLWYTEPGEPPRAKVRESGKIIELRNLEYGTLIEFPCYRGVGPTKEVVLEGETWPSYHIRTCRRGEDGVGIEFIIRGQAGMN